jgi:hypothetical protein
MQARAAGGAVVIKDERDLGPLETERDTKLDGDDIVVLPDADTTRRRRGRPVLVGGATLALLLIIGTIALLTRHDGSRARVQTQSPLPTLPVVAKTHPTPTVPHKKPKPKVAVTTVPATLPQTSVTSGNVSVPPPATTPAPTTPTTVAATKQYGPSVLTWTAPGALVIATGTTKTISVTAQNPSDGTVTLAHPLSCTPRLDHSEMCAQVVQLISAGQSASAQYTIDATGIAAGHYTLRIEGVLSISVTVTGTASSTPPN